MTDIGSDDKETSRVIGIHDGARYIGWLDGFGDVTQIVTRLAAKHRAKMFPATSTYQDALDDVIKGMQVALAEKRKT